MEWIVVLYLLSPVDRSPSHAELSPPLLGTVRFVEPVDQARLKRTQDTLVLHLFHPKYWRAHRQDKLTGRLRDARNGE